MSAQKIGRYEIVKEIGRGGMAIVYLANDPFFERQVAVKVISRKLAEETTDFEQFRARFQREAKVIAALEHTCIVPVYDYGEDDSQPYIVMRYMTGGTLSERMTGNPMPLSTVVPIIQRLAEALQTAHRRGIIHRDLKPGNVLFDAEGHAFLSDFGIAKMKGVSATTTSTGTAIGTFGYMSPEQAQGAREIDGRSDLYALGVILYEMLTGHQPYQADTPLALALKHMTEPIPPLDAEALGLPAELELVLRGALAKRPDDRYSTAEELALALSAHHTPSTTLGAAATTPASSSRPTTPARGGVSPSRPTVRAGGPAALPRLVTVGGGLLGLIVLAALAWVFYSSNQTTAREATATAMEAAQIQTATAIAGAASHRPTSTSPPAATRAPTETFAPSATPHPTSTDTPTPTPTIASGAVITSPVDGMVMVYVPEGEFYMGSASNDLQAFPNEQPQRLVSVSAFWIDQTEVTNARYEKCVSAGVCTEPTSSRYTDPRYGNYPVVTVTWFQAAEYCAWAGGRLPTEAEWEKAARGPASTGGRRMWPWGNNTPSDRLANFNKNEGNTVPAGSYPRGASPYGVLDMAGSAWEWVADYYAEDFYQTASAGGLNSDPTGPEKGVFRVTRGGGYFSDARYIRLAIRAETAAVRVAGYIGFRCARPMTPGTTKPLPTPQP